MKRNEQILLGSLALIGLIAGFWLLVLSPKRHEASQLQSDIDQLQSSLMQARQDIAAGEQARKSFSVDYRRMVVLGKAVPADSEQTSLLVQLQKLADRSGVQFDSMNLGEASTSSVAAAPPPAPTTSTDSSSTSSTSDSSSSSDTTEASTSSSSTSTTATSATASESTVATLPIGATVGPAGLPVMPYELSFTGGFFQISDFMQRLDGLVHTRDGLADVSGRLMTVDGFTLTPSDKGPASEPVLTADLNVTTFLTPPDQGITAGATPTGPETTTLASTPTSSDTGSTAAPAPTSTVSPAP